MKFKTLQIVWHDRQPVFATEFLSDVVLATGGGDKAIRVETNAEAGLGVTLESELTGINGTVNCIRRAPRYDLFASGGDKGEVIVWKRNAEFGKDSETASQTKPWKPATFLRGHANDVFDMSWSSDGSCLATASLEGVTILWDVQRERPKIRLCDHHHYVQGVAWDPLNQFVVTQGGDRRCKVYTRSAASQAKKETAAKSAGQWRVGRTLFKMKAAANTGTGPAKDFLFHDDTLTSFFRRLAWSPEGSFLVVPAGLKKFTSENQAVSHVAYIYLRGKWSMPAICLLGIGEPFVVVRFCPVLFENSRDENENLFSDLPYTVVFACATLHNIFIYTSQKSTPVAFLCGLHYSAITDMAWSTDGTRLVIAARDGYCSMVQFEKGELGIPLDRATLVSTNSAASEWFGTLEEVQTREDLLPAKRHIQPQKLAADERTFDFSARNPSAVRNQTRTRRRITPTAVKNIEEESSGPPPKEADEKITEILSSRQASSGSFFADLQNLTGEGEQAKTDSPKKTSLADLLAMSARHAKDRFGM